MNYSEHTYFNEEHSNMQGIELQTLIASRLEDMAEQVNILYSQGDFAEAELLREEGLQLAEAYDNEATFLFINDLTTI
jgi:hypothetical protein